LDYITRNRVITGRKLVMTSARLWSHKTLEEGVFDMSTTEFDDQLKMVSPELVAAYEKKNLDGKTLATMLQELEMIGSDPSESVLGRIRNHIEWWVTLIFLQVSLPYAELYVRAAVWVILLILTLFFIRHQDLRHSAYWRCQKTIERFQDALGVLNPKCISVTTYNESTTRDLLINLAQTILESESNLDVVRLREKRDVPALHKALRALSSSQELFHKAFVQAQDFGLMYAKETLFTAAARRLERIQKENASN
jgi:hypothetical protein